MAAAVQFVIVTRAESTYLVRDYYHTTVSTTVLGAQRLGTLQIPGCLRRELPRSGLQPALHPGRQLAKHEMQLRGTLQVTSNHPLVNSHHRYSYQDSRHHLRG